MFSEKDIAVVTTWGSVAVILIAVVVAIGLYVSAQMKKEDFKKKQVAAKRKQAAHAVKEKYNNLKQKVERLTMEKKKISEEFTRLASCPKSSIRENYCSCTGSKCTCKAAGSSMKEAYATPNNIPVRPMQNLVAGPVGKAKQLKAEQALRGAAAGLPMPTGQMLGKEAILTAGGAETFRPNRGMY